MKRIDRKYQAIINLWKDYRGAAAIEFALVVLPFAALVFAIMELGYKSLVQSELDSTTQAVYEDISLHSSTAKTWQEYRDLFCGIHQNYFLNCRNITFSTVVVPGRLYTFNNVVTGGAWNIGCASDVVLIELLYPLTNIVHRIVIGDIVTFNGAKSYRARAVLKREPLVDGGSC